MTRRPRPTPAKSAAAGCAAALLAAPLAAQAGGAPPLSVSQAWMRALAGPTPAAGYFTLSNRSAKPRVLVAAASPDCAQLMMHQSREVNGVAQMSMVARLDVPAHGAVTFAPGGYHLMCMSPSKAVRPGASVPVILRFEGGERLHVRFPVRGPAG